jgi:hypothetical protein
VDQLSKEKWDNDSEFSDDEPVKKSDEEDEFFEQMRAYFFTSQRRKRSRGVGRKAFLTALESIFGVRPFPSI